MIRILSLCALLVVSTISAFAQAQGSSADLTGVVFDSSRSVVSGATITAVNLQTQLTRTTTSDSNGNYRISLLPPGEYEIKVKASGFNLQVKRGIVLTVGQTAVINFDLLIGVKMETEVIETAMPLIEPERTHQASTITQKQISNLPINGRNFMEFTRLAPGVVEESPTVTNTQAPQLPTSGLSFAGQSGRANSTQIDGVSNNDIASNGVRPTLSQEAIREFQINRHGYSAEFGRASGGVINIVSKSGSNEFHGNFYNYFRNERLDARNTFASSFQQDPPFKRNQPGFTFGGPLRRDRTFFFLASEGLLRRESAITTVLNDPSILNPTSAQQDLINTLINSGNAAAALQGQQLQALLTTGPNSPPPTMGPLQPGQPFQQNLSTFNFLTSAQGIFPVQESSSTTSLRIDEALREQDYLFLRANYTNDTLHNTGVGGLSGPSAGFDNRIIDRAIVVGENHIFRNGASNEFRFEFSRNVFNAHTVDPFGPQYLVPSVGTFGRDFNAPSDRTQYRYQFLDNYSFKRGRNNVKFGGDFSHYRFNVSTPLFGGGVLDFSPVVPLGTYLAGVYGPAALAQLTNNLQTPVSAGGFGRPDLVQALSTPLTSVQHLNLGLPRVINQGFGDPTARISGNILGLYAQDGLQLKPNLYLNLGLRYDYDLQPTGTPRDPNNFGPRVGFTYSPSRNGKTVIRGGGGLYYQSLYSATSFISRVLGQGQITNILVSIDPTMTPAAPNSVCAMAPSPSACFYQTLVSTGVVGFNSIGSIPQSAYANLLGLTTATSNNRVVIRLHNGAVNPYSLQGSLGVDREFGRDLFVSVSYLVNHGVKLGRTRQSNTFADPTRLDAFGRPSLTGRLDPTRLVDFVYETAGNSIYHGLAVSMNKRFNRNFQLIAAYTVSKAIDDATDLNLDQGPQDPTNARLDRGLSSFNVAHRLSLSSLIDSPFRSGAGQPFYQRALSNFYISPIVTARSGFPFNIQTGVDINGDNNNNDRPFAIGRNTGMGPAFFSTDLRVGRKFALGADNARSIEAILDTFNIFNRVNYRDVNNNTGGVLYLDQLGYSDSRISGCSDKSTTSLCGFTSTYDPRVLQLALKLNF
ncbi:MAG TPA: TonB-dependent receptor [Blastocatellia bacterium]|nr:TonB-dependent receptor [Blastocatellia bacterium]